MQSAKSAKILRKTSAATQGGSWAEAPKIDIDIAPTFTPYHQTFSPYLFAGRRKSYVLTNELNDNTRACECLN